MRLYTERLALRELTLADAEAANAYERDETVVRYQSHGVRTVEESRAYIERVIEESARSPRRLYDLAITARGDDRLIGRAGFALQDEAGREAMLWYVLHPVQWGKGYAVEAMRALIGFAFGELGLHRVYLDTDPRNRASVRVAQKLGMRQEAHFRENYWCKGEWTDSLIFALLEREWPREGHPVPEPAPGDRP